MTYLYGFTIDELKEILAACNREMIDGTVTAITSLGTSATFYKMTLERRIELVTNTLRVLCPNDPMFGGPRLKTGRANYYWTF